MDLSKVNIDVIARWVTVKITEVLGFEGKSLVLYAPVSSLLQCEPILFIVYCLSLKHVVTVL